MVLWAHRRELGFSQYPRVEGFQCRGGPLGKTSLGEVCSPCVGPEHPQPPAKRARLWHIKYLIGRKGTHWAHQE